MTGRGERWRAKAARAAAVLLLCGAAALAASFPAFQATSAGPTERWYIVRIGGQNVGYVHDTTAPLPGGAGPGYATTSEMSFALNRLGARVELVLSTSAEESASGSLRKLSFDLKASVLTMRTEVTVKPGVLEIKSGAGGTPFARTMPYTGELVGPEGTRRLTLEKLRRPGDRAEYQTFEPSLGKVVKAVRVLLGPDFLSLDGTVVPALKVEETNDALPDKRTFWLGDDGEVLRDEEPSPFGLAEVVRADRAEAMAAAGGGELPSEFFEQTLLKTGLRLPRPRDIEYLKVRLVHRRPELGWPEIPGSDQRVVAKTSTSLDLEVRRTEPGRAAPFPVPASDRNRADLEPNAYLQSDDPGLRALAASLVGTETDAWRAALKLRRWVADHMTFDLGIAFAPSVEIYRNRRGTCVGYATILAALARAAGIPSRVVIGYAYTLGLFGGHAWTEVLIGDRWVALDAALPSPGSADAARFHLVDSTLADGAGTLVEGAQRVMGYIDVQVLEYRVEGGRTIRVPSGARPYEVKGDTYHNPWLGLDVRAPEGFRFGRLDAVWPSTRLVEMFGPNGSRLELHEIPVAPWDKPDEAAWSALAKLGVVSGRRTIDWAGRKAYKTGGDRTAACAVPAAGELWVLKAEGTDAVEVLEETARMIRFGRS